MVKKRRQEKIVNSRLLFPIILIYSAILMALMWNSQPQMWMQGLSIASTTLFMLALNNRYALLRVYSRMVSIAYLVLSMMLLQEPFGLAESIIPVCFAAFSLFFSMPTKTDNRLEPSSMPLVLSVFQASSVLKFSILYPYFGSFSSSLSWLLASALSSLQS